MANTLIWGQLECGGWNYVFDFAGENSLKSWYDTVGKMAGVWRNFNIIMEMRLMMMRVLWRLLNFYFVCMWKNDPAFRPALEKTIDFVLKSQYPVGGWPQRYPLMYDHPFKVRKIIRLLLL